MSSTFSILGKTTISRPHTGHNKPRPTTLIRSKSDYLRLYHTILD